MTATSKKVKLTSLQQQLKDELDRGVKLVWVNTHHKSGGDLVLESNLSQPIYKTFWSLMYKLHGKEYNKGVAKQYFKQKN